MRLRVDRVPSQSTIAHRGITLQRGFVALITQGDRGHASLMRTDNRAHKTQRPWEPPAAKSCRPLRTLAPFTSQSEHENHAGEDAGDRHGEHSCGSAQLHGERCATCSAREGDPRSSPQREYFATCPSPTLTCAAREVTFYLALPFASSSSLALPVPGARSSSVPSRYRLPSASPRLEVGSARRSRQAPAEQQEVARRRVRPCRAAQRSACGSSSQSDRSESLSERRRLRPPGSPSVP
jgi:hypothetical protein